MSKSNYSYIISDGVLCITDHCGPVGMSVTNNAENVLDEIKAGFLKADSALTYNTPMPEIIIYCDTDGRWDGMEYDGRDVQFYILNTDDLPAALEMAKSRKNRK